MSNWSEILTVVNQSFPTNIDLLNKKRKEYSKHPTPILAVWTISATFAPC